MSTSQTISAKSEVPVVPPHNWPDIFRRFADIASGFWGAGNWPARALLAGLIALTAAQVAVQVALNLWTEHLFDAFGTKSMSGFFVLAGAFALILITNLIVTTVHLRVRRKLQVDWRLWLTHRLAGGWMASGRHYHMAQMSGDHDNPDGRLSEDVRIATEAAVDLGHSLLYCIMLLASFIHILWTLSGHVSLSVDGIEVDVPGHLVWIAMAYAAVGSTIALLLGSRLVVTAEARQTYEANFRFGLVHARENSSAIALVHGEVAERRRFRLLLRDAAAAWQRQTDALFRFTIFSSSWTVLSPVFPILVAAPRYIAGAITLGVLMQIAQAFQQAVGALSWPIDNLSHVAEWRASVERILGLQAGIARAKNLDWNDNRARIQIGGSGDAKLSFRDVSIFNPAGEIMVDHLTAEIELGQRIWLYGEPAATIAVAKVLMGLWTSGRGRIDMPNNGPLHFMPQIPYLPLAPLREVVAYPVAPGDEHEEKICHILRQAGLPQLIEKLSDTETWEEILSLGEQQRLGFARLLFHRPRWLILEQPADALSETGQREMMHLLETEFPDAAIIFIGDSRPASGEWERIVLGTASLAEAPATSGLDRGLETVRSAWQPLLSTVPVVTAESDQHTSGPKP